MVEEWTETLLVELLSYDKVVMFDVDAVSLLLLCALLGMRCSCPCWGGGMVELERAAGW